LGDKSFVHLHNHADASQLDGLSSVKGLAKVAASLGQPAIAITDHGSMAATFELGKACKDQGIKPIFGIEAYMAPDVPRTHKSPVKWAEGGGDDVSGAGAYLHATMWAENDEGLRNLMRISSYAYMDGFYRKPRADEELLQQYGRGIIATTGCPSGGVQTWLRIGEYEKAREYAAKIRDILEPGNFFVEVMDHGLEIERRVQKDLLRLAKDLDLPVVATNDSHYLYATDATVHDALLCIGSGSRINDTNRFRFDGNGYYLKSAEEMRQLWDGEVPEACDNTLLIAERCTAKFHEGENYMPEFPVPAGETEASWLRKETERGLARRYPDGVTGETRARAEYELGIIEQMGFPGYFLVVADFINWAKDNGILVGPGRGSAAGSLVAYALAITDLDPIKYNLLFERFLNPERVSMPDVDIDFDDRRRGEVINYVTEKYGADKVGQIATWNVIKAKAAIKDAARVMDYPFAFSDKITKLYPPPVVGRDLSLAGAFDPSNERFDEAKPFRELVASDPEVRAVVDLARGLEGTKRGHGMHAAGVLMSREPLIDHVPLVRRDPNSPLLAGFEYKYCETLGLLKMDFLGLSNLGTITEALKQIKSNRGVEVKLRALVNDMTDSATFSLLARGETLGVFQLDSPPMRSLLRLMNPDSFEDISAVLALYRPGPMAMGAHTAYADRKNGRSPVSAIHPELGESLSDILDPTYGLIVYQEQIMAIAQRVAGYTLGGADLLRRAMGKKDRDVLAKEFAGFSDGMKANGYSEAAIQALWDTIAPFADYAFNRSHSACYGAISYMTAYLKANFPTEYMAALLTTNADNKDKSAVYLAECRRMGIQVLSPDVNLSDAHYTAHGDDIRAGLAAVKNVGLGAVESWLAEREANGPARSFADFLDRAEASIVKKRSVESLIKAGAFDSFGDTRAGLMLVHEEAVERAMAVKKGKAKNQDSLFGEADHELFAIDVPVVEEWDRRVLLGFEREMLGLYVSDHPLSDLADALRGWADTSIADVRDGAGVGGRVKVAGLVTSVERKVTRKGDPWALVQLEDLEGSIPVFVFPRTFQQVSEFLKPDAVMIVSANSERREDGTVSLMAQDMRLADVAGAQRSVPGEPPVARPSGEQGPPAAGGVVPGADGDKPVRVRVVEAELSASAVDRLKGVLGEHRGSRPVVLVLVKGDGSLVQLRLGDEFKVNGSAFLAAELRGLFGPDCV